MGQRYRKTEDVKPWPGFLRNQDFADERGPKPKVKMSESGDTLGKLVYLKRITDGGLQAEPPAPWQFFAFFEKLAILI